MTDKSATASTSGEGAGWQVLVILLASAFTPLTVLANAGESPVLPTLIVAFALILAIGLAIWLLLRRFGFDPPGSSYATALFMLAVTTTGDYVGDFHPLDRLGILLGAILIGAIAYRLRRLWVFRIVVTWFLFVLVAYPVTVAISRSGITGAVGVDAATDFEVPTIDRKPDILVVFFDGYGSKSVLEEFYGFDNTPVLEELESLGFYASGSVLANYARTQLSIPSVVQLGYVADEGEIYEADIDALQKVANGENRLAHSLRGHGYRSIYVESGWLGSQCSESVDVCIGSPWPDETFYDVAYRSILRGMPGFELGRSFTEGALHVTDWLAHDLSGYLSDDTPDYIFAHLLLPHPPLFLDSGCVPDWAGGLSGFAIGRPAYDEGDIEAARRGYVSQVECVNEVVLEVARLADADDAVVMLGDHGPDSLGQLFIQGTDWSDAQRRERFGAFFAAKVPGCDMSQIESLVNVGRRILSCLGSAELPDLPTRIYDMHKAPGGSTIHQLELPAA